MILKKVLIKIKCTENKLRNVATFPSLLFCHQINDRVAMDQIYTNIQGN